jgi:predicted enzyme related to lactoylglutathione lyase
MNASRFPQPNARSCRKWLGASVTGCGTIGRMSDLITKLVPILHVQDPDAERRFYEQLGLCTTYEGPEYPGFIAVGNDAVEFGLSRRPGADPAASGLTWQLGVSDVDAAITACEQSGLRFEVSVERPREDWTYRIVKVQSPNGMEVLLEEQAPPN